MTQVRENIDTFLIQNYTAHTYVKMLNEWYSEGKSWIIVIFAKRGLNLLADSYTDSQIYSHGYAQCTLLKLTGPSKWKTHKREKDKFTSFLILSRPNLYKSVFLKYHPLLSL